MARLRLALVQASSDMTDPEANAAKLVRVVREARADLVVFPEGFLTGYNHRSDSFARALDLDAGPVRRVCEVASECGVRVLFGMLERSSSFPGQVYNSAVWVGPDGIEGVYRKGHLVTFGPFEEHLYLTPGHGAPIFRVGGVPVGVIICYDLFFPESAKRYALAGAQLVIGISASPINTKPFFEAMLPARAIENTVFVAYANVAGTQKNLVFWGGSQLWGPRGDRLARGPDFDDAVVACEIDTDDLYAARQLRPTLRDTRREEIIGMLDALDKRP